MINAQATQFKLNDDGQVFYQADASNPMPGVAVAHVRKGDALLAPKIEMITQSPDAKAAVEAWLKAHIETVLAPLVGLQGDESLSGPVKEIADKVYAGTGIAPREELQEAIAQLDQDTRRTLRAKNIRLGPVLAFQPDLNKPAAVRLRGLLWWLYHDKALPAPLPNDGVVSFKIDAANVERDFYQVIGYPVYGPRAIRIDMLDRVINAIYEQAQGGKFQAKHEMAEWFGCSIPDLYEVLSAMGHTLVHDPAPEQEAAKEAKKAEAEKAGEEAIADAPKAEEAAKPEEQVKPELATFRLKKGKAFEKASAKPAQENRKPKDQKKGKGKRNKSTNKSPRVMSAEAKSNPEDSPFAILQQLQAGKNAK